VAAVTNFFGQDLVYNITVTSPQGGTPTGTVTVTEGGNPVAYTGGDLSGGATTITIAAGTLSVGTHTLRFPYAGSSVPPPGYGTIFTDITQSITRASTIVSSLTSSVPGTSEFGQAVTFTAVVTVTAGAGQPITGTVIFKDGATTLPGTVSVISGPGAN